MPLAQKYIPHYTYSDWLHWEGRWELIEGVPIAMSPMPLPEHQRVASELRTELTLALRKSGCKHCRAYDPVDFKISDETILQPDILIVCGKILKNYLDYPPMLVVEVLSKSTEERDRGIKYDFYEQEGVKYYLIVDVKKKLIQIYQLINGKYELQTYADDFCFNLSDDCSINPRLDNIWE
ncbi:MAG TPA: Uma2 family endonuclease [Segetibacter sp.]